MRKKEKMVGWNACHRKCISFDLAVENVRKHGTTRCISGLLITTKAIRFLNELLARFKEQL